MTNAECDEFISYLTSLFPDVERWLIEQNEAAKEKGLGEEVVQSAWYRSLAFVTLRGARQAVDIMLGDEDQQPKGYTKLPARIGSEKSPKPSSSSSRLIRCSLGGRWVMTICNTR